MRRHCPATSSTPLPPTETPTPTTPPIQTPTETTPPVTETPPPSGSGEASGSFTVDQLLAIDSNTASCDGAPFAEECADATKAAPFIGASFDKYGITSAGEKAALISLILFETGSLKYDRNHFPEPGRPGQGTRNLMMWPGVYQYATTLAETSAEAMSLAPSQDAAGDDVKNQVRALVLKDEFSFASAAWYYKTNCGDKQDIVDGLKAGTQAGWEQYITQCVFTTVTGDRQSSWQKALEVLNK
ncbi:hypothetical protein BKA62DRAFT_618935 [Auriculariales sp. MPI-PUGE-AT-0066]|nr:hypothetical protein BKA62DRAFT_618935 [Auriculariales sp. MPI-PUGE-AT-0066]